MRLLVLNPNSSTSMTEMARGLAARAAESCGLQLEVEGWTNETAPSSIQGPEDGAKATPPLLQRIEQASKEADVAGVIVACSDDIAVETARGLVRRDQAFLSIGEAAYRAAALRSRPFAIVTSVKEAIPILEGRVRTARLEHLLVGVRASAPVLKIAAQEPGAVAAVSDAVQAAIAEDKAESIVLGCCAMGPLADELSRRHGIPVICGVTAATLLMPVMLSSTRSLQH